MILGLQQSSKYTWKICHQGDEGNQVTKGHHLDIQPQSSNPIGSICWNLVFCKKKYINMIQNQDGDGQFHDSLQI